MSNLNHHPPTDPLTNLVRSFLNSNLSIILIVFSLILGAAALVLTPREEDPQIVVPIADIFVNFPGHSVAEVEQLIAVPLERILYQIDGVEYVYSMSRENQVIITVRFFVGQDRERSLVKLFKKMDESQDQVPLGVKVKPVDDSPGHPGGQRKTIGRYVRHHWGPARGFGLHPNSPGTVLGATHSGEHDSTADEPEHPRHFGATAALTLASSDAVTLAVSKQKGANAVHVADRRDAFHSVNGVRSHAWVLAAQSGQDELGNELKTQGQFL